MIEYKYIKTNGITLHVQCVGDKNNKLLILLHGFPDFHKGWEKQIEDLEKAGYYILVPDQRGYNLSDKPWRIGSYRLDKLAMDIIGLIDYMGRETAYIAGHDWGAGVAWYMGIHHHKRIDKLIIANVPHTKVMVETIKNDKEQRKKSSYMFRFQLPLIPQRLLTKDNYKLLEKAMVRSALKGSFTEDDIVQYKKAWSQKRAVVGMLNWYRAAFRRKAPYADYDIPVKTLILWGENDKFLKREMGEKSLEYCEDGRIEYIDNAGHWVLREQPEIVCNLMIDFFKS